LALPEVPTDPLKFRDERRYTDRLKDARGKTGLSDAVLAGAGRLEGQRIVAAVQDFDFLGGSLGTAAGEAVIAAMRTAVRRETPFILFAASGGARMQEGILSLMQMPRTTGRGAGAARGETPLHRGAHSPNDRRRHRLLCHARRHPYRRARRADWLRRPARHRADHSRAAPNGFQRAEYLYDHGMVDMVVHRHALRGTLARLCNLLTRRRPGRDIAVSDKIDGKVALKAPASTIALSGNGLDRVVGDDHEDDEDLTGDAGIGPNPNQPQTN
jgi:acetyl-CoA carboxylase carboxyl transferase subunit beta